MRSMYFRSRYGMLRLVVAAVLSSVAVAAAAATATTLPYSTLPYSTLVNAFAYDASKPLDLRVKGPTKTVGTTKIETVSFSVDGKVSSTGYLVLPGGHGPFAGVVFAPYRGGSREQFLSEATQLAARGVVSLSLDDFGDGFLIHVKGNPFLQVTHETHRVNIIRRVVALRRGLDVLLARSDVDPKRLAVVGHSDGAELDSVLAGVDHRIVAAVLMGLGNGFGYPFKLFDEINFIGHAAPVSLFIQAGRADEYVPRKDTEAFARTASNPKRITWYATNHEGLRSNEQAVADRDSWLAAKLKLPPG